MLKNTKIAHGLAVSAGQIIFDLGFESKETLFVSDEKIWKNCKNFFEKNFVKKIGKILLLKTPHADEKNLQKILKAAQNFNYILCLGSGTINDLCKFTSAQKNIPYAIFASAASMNGYLSRNASIKISGHKKTLPATLPVAVFCDLGILKTAPVQLTKAGIGDIMCFYSCWFDWYLSHKILGTKFDKKPFTMLRKKMDFFVKNFGKFSIYDEEFLKLLIEILLLSGKGMTIAGGSYPASQSEHLIAHTIEMKYPKIAAKKLHGEVIAVTTLTAARLQKEWLESFVSKGDGRNLNIKTNLTKDDFNKKLEKFFGKKVAVECEKEYKQKTSLMSKAKPITPLLQKKLQEIYFDEAHLKKLLSHFKIKISVKSLGLSNQQYQACVEHAKFIRNRFTCLDFY